MLPPSDKQVRMLCFPEEVEGTSLCKSNKGAGDGTSAYSAGFSGVDSGILCGIGVLRGCTRERFSGAGDPGHETGGKKMKPSAGDRVRLTIQENG